MNSGEGSAFPQPYSGTCSSTGDNVTLNDTGDLGNLAVGDFIRNVTDGSWAFVTVAGTNSITTTQLQGGSDNTWTSGDTWRANEFVVTLAKINGSGVDTQVEEVLISNRSTDTLTVPSGGRGYNGTIAQSFDTDDYVQLRITSPYHEELKSLAKEMKEQVDTNTDDLDAVEAGTSLYVAAAGSSNAYTGTLSALPAAYTTGERFTFKANHSNTAAATFNRASLGAKTLKKRTSAGLSDVEAGDIQNGDMVEVIYDGTYYQILSHYSNAFVTLSSIGLFGDASDGSVTWSTSTNLDPSSEYNYVDATLNASQTLSVSSVNTPLVIHNTGNVTINGTVDLSGKGGAGGAGHSGSDGSGNTGTAGNSRISGWTNGAGVGGSSTDDTTGAGGGSSSLADGDNGATSGGAGGTMVTERQLAILANFWRGVVCGGGGGGGGRGSGAGTGGNGGAGGGALVWYIGGNLTLGASSIIQCHGADATDGSGTTGGGGVAGGGGGGGGGQIFIIVAGTITDSGVTLTANGGGNGIGHRLGITDSSDNGGDGADGQIIIHSLSDGTLLTS